MNIFSDMWAGFTALVDSVTEPAYLIIVGPVAVVGFLFVWAEHRTDRVRHAQEAARKATLAYWADENPELAHAAEQQWRGRNLPTRGLGGAA